MSEKTNNTKKSDVVPAYNIKVSIPDKIIKRVSAEEILKRNKCGL